MKLKDQVEHVLKNHSKGRDDDQWLTIKIWTLYYESRIDRSDPENPKVKLRDIMLLPREDNVKRIRAHFQNVKKMYPPTSLGIVRKRKQNEDVWRSLVNSEYKRL